MRLMHCPLRFYLAKAIVKTEPSLIQSEVFDQIVEPPNPEMGDLAFPCFLLAKQKRKSPVAIATELAQSLTSMDGIASIQAAGPYVNIIFEADFIGKELLSKIADGSFFHIQLTDQNPKTMIEYSQPNTHKELHVGHMRNAALGDAVVHTLRYSGTPVVTTTFPGDMGTHVAKCLWYLKYHNREAAPETNKGEWLGRMYSRAHLKLEDEEKTPAGENNKRQLTEILKELESQRGEFFELWKETKEWSVELMKKVYTWAGIEFDQWYWESEVDAASVHYVKALFHQGKLVESQGAIGMDLSDQDLGFCLLLKSDGTGLYATKDLELARKKFQDFNIDKSIYVVDLRQALHFKQIFQVLENLGFEQASACFHLQYNFVELPDGAMSSRKGNIVPLLQLIHGMEALVKQKYLVRYQGEWSQQEIDLVASQVAQGAIKYGMVKIDQNKKIVFDMDEWLKIDGDSGPSIQYSVARIHSLCEKMGYDGQSGAVEWGILNHSAERLLMKSLMNFHAVVLSAAEGYKPSLICTYLFETAKRFNFFYHECSIGNAETPQLKQARLALSYCTGQVLTKGLLLLGIPSPRRM